jgi:hypothetical protein
LFGWNKDENDEFDHKEGFGNDIEDMIIEDGFDFHDFGDETDFMDTGVFQFFFCLIEDMFFKREIKIFWIEIDR